MFNSEQMEKLRMIDQFFDAFSVEDFKELIEREEIVARLKGKATTNNPLTNLVLRHQAMNTQIMSLQAEVSSLKYDIQQIVKVLVKPYDYSASCDINTLKSKHNIY